MPTKSETYKMLDQQKKLLTTRLREMQSELAAIDAAMDLFKEREEQESEPPKEKTISLKDAIREIVSENPDGLTYTGIAELVIERYPGRWSFNSINQYVANTLSKLSALGELDVNHTPGNTRTFLYKPVNKRGSFKN